MGNTFPPRTSREGEVHALLNILGSVIPDGSAVYVSAPITSGKRLANWVRLRNMEPDLSHPETYQEFLREVLEPNCEHAKAIVAKLRETVPKALVDPTRLEDIDGWTQDDYRYLWGRVIQQYIETVVFIDGWQYSNGCCYEFLVCYQSSVGKSPTTVSESLKPLTLEAGIALIHKAIRELKSSNLSVAFLEQVAEELAIKAAPAEEYAKQ